MKVDFLSGPYNQTGNSNISLGCISLQQTEKCTHVFAGDRSLVQSSLTTPIFSFSFFFSNHLIFGPCREKTCLRGFAKNKGD